MAAGRELLRTPRMVIELILRRFSVGQRIGLIIVLLLTPLATLSAVSAAVLNQQEMALRDSVEESLHMLLPLTTLEQLLDRALVDELEAQSHKSVPGFASLTENIDHSFTTVEIAGSSPTFCWSGSRPRSMPGRRPSRRCSA